MDAFQDDDDYYECSQNDQNNEISVAADVDVMDDDEKNLIDAEIAPAIEAVNPVTMNNIPDDIKNTENIARLDGPSSDGFHSTNEILTVGIKCEFVSLQFN